MKIKTTVRVVKNEFGRVIKKVRVPSDNKNLGYNKRRKSFWEKWNDW